MGKKPPSYPLSFPPPPGEIESWKRFFLPPPHYFWVVGGGVGGAHPKKGCLAHLNRSTENEMKKRENLCRIKFFAEAAKNSKKKCCVVVHTIGLGYSWHLARSAFISLPLLKPDFLEVYEFWRAQRFSTSIFGIRKNLLLRVDTGKNLKSI